MNTFDSILITHKPGGDNETWRVVECIRSYAEYRKIPIIEYTDKLDNRVLIVSIGGDGTMLNAMRISAHYKNSTVFGLNTGTLGFLTEEIPHNLFVYLDHILFDKNTILEKRMILESSYTIDCGEPSHSFIAVNEFVLTASINAPLITEVYINEQFVSQQLGSGMLIASATGSTAMSLSAGGAIVSPSTNIMQIVPLIPHTLTSRPIITAGHDEISIHTTLTERVPSIEIHADGKTICCCSQGTGTEIELTIRRHSQDVKIWRPKDWNFFNILTEKMKW